MEIDIINIKYMYMIREFIVNCYGEGDVKIMMFDITCKDLQKEFPAMNEEWIERNSFKFVM